MLIRLASDLHLEFGSFSFPKMEGDDQTTLVLAGDIHVDKGSRIKDELLPFITECSKQFKFIIIICGNHEFYHGSLIATPIKIRETLAHLKNVYFLDNESVAIDDVLFVGSTLWTDFNKRDPLVMHAAGYGMNDYKIIRTGTAAEPFKRPASPNDTLMLHDKAKQYVFDTIKNEKPKYRKVVLVVHQAPTWQSIHEMFTGDMLNGAFASDLSNEILDTEPDLIIHGHTHTNFDYMVGYYTRVICNPRGYWGHELNPGFNPIMRIEL